MSPCPSPHLSGQPQATLNPQTPLLKALPPQALALLHVRGASAVSALHAPARSTRSFVQERGWAEGTLTAQLPVASPGLGCSTGPLGVGRPWPHCGYIVDRCRVSHMCTHARLAWLFMQFILAALGHLAVSVCGPLLEVTPLAAERRC